MKLLEIVPGSDTDPETVEALNLFALILLRKGLLLQKIQLVLLLTELDVSLCLLVYIKVRKLWKKD